MHLQQTKRGSRATGGPQYYFHDLEEHVVTYLRKKKVVPVALVTPYGATPSHFVAVSKDAKLRREKVIGGKVGHDRIQQASAGSSIGEAIRQWYKLPTRVDFEKIDLEDAKDRLLGCIVGTSDLIAQMADRQYIEKCRDFLYWEFVWAGIARETQPDGREIVRYASATDLVIKTPGFYQYLARPRIEKRLQGVDRYAEAHLDGRNLYQEEIARNMQFLHETIERGEFNRLRRIAHSMSQPVPDRPRDAHD